MKVGIEFGCLSRPFVAQLRAQKIHLRSGGRREILQCQKDSDAVARLAIRRIITERQRDAARVRILKAILRQCFVSPQTPSATPSVQPSEVNK